MPDVPKKRTITVVRHEWVIGEESKPTNAKDFRYGLHSIYTEMEALGIDLTYDDCFYVRVGDGAEVILFTETEEE